MTTSFGWILLAACAYGVLHSLLASHSAKRLAYHLGGSPACRFYRLFFNVVAVIALAPVIALVSLLPDAPIYTLPRPWSIFTLAVQAAAALGLVAGVLQTGALSFLGLAQVLNPERVSSDCPPGQPVHPALRTNLVTAGLYRYVRHPLYTFGLLIIWSVPTLTWNLLALNIALTLYIFIGAHFEERKLLREYGPAYASYMRSTPMFLPIKRRPD